MIISCMKSICFVLLLYTFRVFVIFSQESIIIDHLCIDLSEIPAEWIDQAKEDLFIAYGHTSHGSQIISGMDAIESYYTDCTFDWSNEGGEGDLHIFQGDGYGTGYLDHDVGNSGWDDETREYLDEFPACNVIIWSWCGQVDDVNLSTHYFESMEQLESEYPDVIFVYMTGHLEGLGSEGSVYTANQQIRDYCINNNKILFDFADIEKYAPFDSTDYQKYYADDECDYDPDGEEPIDRTQNWANNWLNDNPDHILTAISDLCTSCSHSVSLNCVKKGIAAWHLWARIAGWDGNTDTIPVTSIEITSLEGLNTISTLNSTLQLSAQVLPADATDPEVIWSVENVSGEATVSSDGLVTGIVSGLVKVTATATDGSGVSDDFEITISDHIIPVSDITIFPEGNINTIVRGNTLQVSAEVLPEDATNPDVQWSVENVSGEATVSSDGLVTGIASGLVKVTATATDGSGVSDDFEITISDHIIPVSDITIFPEGNINTIDRGNTLQISAEVLPEDATNPDVQWSVENVSGEATVSSDGLITAITSGEINVIATAIDGSEISDTIQIIITDEAVVHVSEIHVISEDNKNSISEPYGTLQLFAEVVPDNAHDKRVTWEINSITGIGEIDDKGLVRAIDNGIVYATATSLENDSITDNFIFLISGQVPTAVKETSKNIIFYTRDKILYIENSITEPFQVRLIDKSGTIIKIIDCPSNIDSIDLSGIPTGIFILQFIIDKTYVTNELVFIH